MKRSPCPRSLNTLCTSKFECILTSRSTEMQYGDIEDNDEWSLSAFFSPDKSSRTYILIYASLAEQGRFNCVSLLVYQNIIKTVYIMTRTTMFQRWLTNENGPSWTSFLSQLLPGGSKNCAEKCILGFEHLVSHALHLTYFLILYRECRNDYFSII